MKRFATRRLGLESLEDRRVMAGNVIVSVNAGDLFIRGDNNANLISIVQVNTGRYQVSGLPGTRINGGTSPVTTGLVTDDVTITMAGGNDRVTLGSSTVGVTITLPDNLTVNMGAGVDRLVSTRVRANSARIVMGAATENDVDTLIARGSIFRGSATLIMGGGNDSMSLEHSQVAGLLTIQLQAGNDTATIKSGSAGSVLLQCGIGDDFGIFRGTLNVAGDVVARGGAGFDSGVVDPDAVITIGGEITATDFEAGDLAP